MYCDLGLKELSTKRIYDPAENYPGVSLYRYSLYILQ